MITITAPPIAPETIYTTELGEDVEMGMGVDVKLRLGSSNNNKQTNHLM